MTDGNTLNPLVPGADVEKGQEQFQVQEHEVQDLSGRVYVQKPLNLRKPREKKLQNQYVPQPKDTTSADTIWQQVCDKNGTGEYNFERFESMQLLNLCLLQNEIRKLDVEIHRIIEERGKDNPYPMEALHEHVGALRALLKEYNETLLSFRDVMACPKASFRSIKSYDETKVKGVPRLMLDLRRDLESDGVRKFIEEHFPDSVRSIFTKLSIGPGKVMNELGNWHQLPPWTMWRAREHEKAALQVVVDNSARFLVSVFAGVILIVPVIVMIFSKSRNTNLIVTSAFVLFFGIVLSLGSKASNQEILGAVAGYTAVLVVFIGTSGVGE